MQQKYGGEKPILEIDEAETITDKHTKTEWIYTIWEWAQENGIRMRHEKDTDKPKTENDTRLIDEAESMRHKQAINHQ